MCLSKALTAGYMPLSLVVTTDDIYEAFYCDYTEQKAFMHSHSYTGNPIACAIACESLEIFKDDDVLAKNDLRSKYIDKLVSGFSQNHPHVGEFRRLGMIGALELVEDKCSRKAFAWEKRVGYGIYKIALGKGVLLRPLGNVIYFMPPYIVEKKDIELMAEVAIQSVQEYFGV
jgi:adenosylmethionine---8-amino-7-oxononanoate aminotransferase